MNQSLQWILTALREVRQATRPVAFFLTGWTLLQALILAPLISGMLEQLIRRSGHMAVSNYDIAAFLLTPSGVAFLMLGGALNLAFLYAQQAGLFLIASRTELGSVPNVVGLLWQNFRRIPALARLGFWQLVSFALLFLPFAAAVAFIASRLLHGHDINFYLATKPPEWLWTVRVTILLLTVYALVGAWLFVRWILAVPYVLLSGERPLQCLRQSWRTTRGRFWSVARPFLCWWSGWLVVSAAVGTAFAALAGVLLDWGGSNPIRTAPLLVVLQATAIVGGTVGALLGGTVHQFLLARTYWHAHPPAPRGVESATPDTPVRLTRAVSVVLGAVFVVSAVGTWRYIGTITSEIPVEITAHRGSSRRAPENTLSAIRQAITEKADYAEIDVQSTKDGHVVLLHDADLMRVANNPRKLQDLTLAELKQLDVGGWFGPASKGERIATLEEAIDIAQRRIKLNIELKYNRPDPALAGRVARILRDKNFTAGAVITSLDASELYKLKQQAPELQTGLIVTAALGDATSLPVDFLSVNAAQVRRDAVSLAHDRGKAVHVWTVNDENAALRLIEMGVDNLITDEPALLVNLRQRLRELNRAELIALALRTRFGL